MDRAGMFANLSIGIGFMGQTFQAKVKTLQLGSNGIYNDSLEVTVSFDAIIKNTTTKDQRLTTNFSPIVHTIKIFTEYNFNTMLDADNGRQKREVIILYKGKEYKLLSEKAVMESPFVYIAQYMDK